MTQTYFVQLKLGKKTYKQKVSTEGFADVAVFKGAIKNKFSPYLDFYTTIQLTLLQPDGATEIDPAEQVTKLDDFGIGPWKPIIVTVDELPEKGSSTRQLSYKKMSVEASCLKYFDALAEKLSTLYEFPCGSGESKNTYVTLGDVLSAKHNNDWEHRYYALSKQERVEVDFEGFTFVKKAKEPLLNIPLPKLFTEEEWKKLKELNKKINERIHDADLPRSSSGKLFVILPSGIFSEETATFFKTIGIKGKLFKSENDLIVKDEGELSGSSESDSSSPV